MGKNITKVIVPALLVMVAIILVVGTFLKSDNAAIIGKWILAPTEVNGYSVYEFHADNSGVCYDVYTDGNAYDSESFNYKLHDSNITLNLFGVTRVYSYEISGKSLLLDDRVYVKATGGSNVSWVRYLIALLCLMAAVIFCIVTNTPVKKHTSSKATLFVEPKKKKTEPVKTDDVLGIKKETLTEDCDKFKSAGDL